MNTQEFVRKYNIMEEETEHVKKEVKLSILSMLSNVQVFCLQSEREYIDHIKRFVSDYFEIKETPSE